MTGPGTTTSLNTLGRPGAYWAMVRAVPYDNRLYKLTNCITGDLVGLQPIGEVVTANGGAQTEQPLSCSWQSA
jgi:hypothetical protein